MNMDNGFSVLKGLIGMFQRGVYGSALLKKRRYCTGGICGYQINVHCAKKRQA